MTGMRHTRNRALFSMGGRRPLLWPAAGHDPAPFDAGRLDRVDPGELAGTVHRDGHQHASVETAAARAEAL